MNENKTITLKNKCTIIENEILEELPGTCRQF